jgi:hypothetical protein
MLEKVETWKAILKCLVKVGSDDGGGEVDYFSSLIPRHLRSYARMMDANYGPETTKEQLKEDWALSAVTDVLSRVARSDDDSYRRGVRILQHFIDFSVYETVSSEGVTDHRDSQQVRFDLYDSMDRLRTLGKEDESSYELAVTELRELEAEIEL